MTDYLKEAQTVLARAKTLMEENKWVHVTTTKETGTELQKREIPEVCPIPCYLVKTTIKKPVHEMVNKSWVIDENRIKFNDPSVKEWKELEKTDTYKICTQYNKMGMFISDRQVVYAQVKIEEPGATYLVSFSVTHPLAPPDENFVRSHIHMSVFEFKKNKDGDTDVTKIAQIDPCGDIPVFVVNMVANRQVEMLDRWKKEE